ncbi:MAG: hypothetical protein HQM10_18025 [Candidatus Riflebacteria bacterium]|nr:hypothetical protein [Candidatus Riflebacteria bacterium]
MIHSYRNGFAYIVAVLVLGMFAFMGMFLMQSSSAEYSQAAISCYTTMAQQLAEAAADEAFQMIEKELSMGKKGPLLQQCQTSDFAPGGTTGINPKLLDVLPDYKAHVRQTRLLISYMSRAGFEIEAVQPSLTDCRPIDHFNFGKNIDQCMYRPKDRSQLFDTKMSRDYYLSISFNVVVSLKISSKKHKFRFQMTRDAKVVNIGPVARNYTLFSMMGPECDPNNPTKSTDEIKNDLSLGSGRLLLWNHPFQSRVYIHGPSVIRIENPDLETPQDVQGNYQGAYLINTTDGKPGPVNQAFQYSDTYAGSSYLPYGPRAFWGMIDVSWWNNEDNHKNDLAGMTDSEKQAYRYNTYKKGILPKLNAEWTDMNEWIKTGESYARGTTKVQKFLPAGPYCRLPWRFVPQTYQPNYTNLTKDKWPVSESELNLEHRWLDGSSDMDGKTKIIACLRKFRWFRAGGAQSTSVQTHELFTEFSLSYNNPKDATGFWSAFTGSVSNIGATIWNSITALPVLAWSGGESLWRVFFKPSDPTAPEAPNDSDFRNFYPTNFKDYRKIITKRLNDINDIPKDPDKTWILNGAYWLQNFNLREDVVYRGKGIIFVGDYYPQKPNPFIIAGSILSRRTVRKTSDDDHLTIVYHPFITRTASNGASQVLPADMETCQIIIEGKRRIIEASVYSLAGIKTSDGILEPADYVNLGMDPIKPTHQWKVNFPEIQNRVNTIIGNYSNFYMKKKKLNGDLWVIHDTKSPYYFDQKTLQSTESFSDDDKYKYEIMSHIVAITPRIQHLAFSGGN